MKTKYAVLLMLAVSWSVIAYAKPDSTFIITKPVVLYNKPESRHKDLEDGYIMKGRKMMTVKNDIFTIMEKDITLSNGTVVKSSGSYTEIGGTKILFKEGDFIDLKGVYFPMKQY